MTSPIRELTTFVRGQSARELTREALQERMVFLMVNEAARCLEEKIVAEPADVDFAMIMGTEALRAVPRRAATLR